MRGTDILSLPKPATTFYGLNLFSILLLTSRTRCLTNREPFRLYMALFQQIGDAD